MRVAGLFRHPVKSLQGESLASAALDADGLSGDRAWGIRDEATGRILTARRKPQLLLAAAAMDGERPIVTLPSGAALRNDADLSGWLGAPARLVKAADAPGGRAEYFADSTDDASRPVEWTMPAGRFVDLMPVLLLTTASLRAAAALYPGGDWNVRRFRPNVLIEAEGDGFPEDAWCGGAVRIGDAEFLPQQRCIRCTMVRRAQPGLADDVDIYKTLARHHRGTFGVWATVRKVGTVRVGDPVRLDPLA